MVDVCDNGNISNLKAFHLLFKQVNVGMCVGDSGLNGSLASTEGGSRLKGGLKVFEATGRLKEHAQLIVHPTPLRSQKTQVLEALRKRWAGSNRRRASTDPS